MSKLLKAAATAMAFSAAPALADGLQPGTSDPVVTPTGSSTVFYTKLDACESATIGDYLGGNLSTVHLTCCSVNGRPVQLMTEGREANGNRLITFENPQSCEQPRAGGENQGGGSGGKSESGLGNDSGPGGTSTLG